MTDSFKKYQEKVVSNAKVMADEFQKQGVRVISRGTDNHLFVVDISPFQLSSKKIQEELENVNIYVNRNTIPFDKKSPFDPSGLRIGSPSIVTRGMGEQEGRKIIQLIVKLIKNFNNQEVKDGIKKEVKEICEKFPIYENLNW